jgi:hypothetical protein
VHLCKKRFRPDSVDGPLSGDMIHWLPYSEADFLVKWLRLPRLVLLRSARPIL